MNKYGRTFLLLSALVLVVSILIFSVFLLFLVAMPSSRFERNTQTPSQYYQYSEYNPFEEGKNNFFLVKLSNPQFNEHGFQSYLNEQTGSTVIISPLSDGSNYRCHGSCSCNEENQSRRISASVPLSRTLMILVSALSSFTAVKIAETTFRDQCTQKFRETCASFEVEIDDCDPVNEPTAEEIEKALKEYEGEGAETEEDDDGLKEHSFFCTGNCMDNTEAKAATGFSFYEMAQLWFQSTCSEIEFQKSVEVICSDFTPACQKRAEKAFALEILKPHCVQFSSLENSQTFKKFQNTDTPMSVPEQSNMNLQKWKSLCDVYPDNLGRFEKVSCLGTP